MVKKSKFSLMRFVLTGLVWTAFYCGICLPIVKYACDFDFDFFSINAYVEKYDAFMNYRWQLNSGETIIQLLLMVLWMPFWLVGFLLSYRLTRSWSWTLRIASQKKHIAFDYDLADLNSNRPKSQAVDNKMVWPNGIK